MNNHIPDISYHNIFCFLPLNELIRIAQCNKEFHRIVTAPSFFNMYPLNSAALKISHNKFWPSPPFLQIIKKIKFCLSSYHSISDFNELLTSLTRLKYLELKYARSQTNWNDFNLSSPNIIKTLETLKMKRFSQQSEMTLSDDLQLLDTICLLTQLKELNIPELFKESTAIHTLRRLCAQPFLTRKLSIIGKFTNVTKEDHFECSKLLSHLELKPSSKYALSKHEMMPIQFSPWINHLYVYYHHCTDDEIFNVFQKMRHLNSLTLSLCIINDNQLNYILEILSERLKKQINLWIFIQLEVR
jgi:hypothetical protein